jgi:hypothetical protein
MAALVLVLKVTQLLILSLYTKTQKKYLSLPNNPVALTTYTTTLHEFRYFKRYAQRGVSASKKMCITPLKTLIKDLFPQAFVKLFLII